MEPAGRPPAPENFSLLTLSISIAIFMAALDGTIVNIALPTISEAFSVSTSTVSWVATIYLLVMAGCVLVFGKVADTIGFKRVFLVGFTLFTLGSFACGLLPDLFHSFLLLIASRIFQAVGGAMMTAIAPAMITAFIPLEQKGKAMGVVMTMAALGTAIGPTLGGVLTQYLSWHWIFFINVPVGIAAVLLGIKIIPGTAGHGSLTTFDRAGAVLVFVGLASLLFVVSEGMHLGWTSPAILCIAILSIVTLAWFYRHERTAPEPLLDLSLFANKNFLFSNLFFSLIFFSFAGINYLLPFYLEYVRGYSISTSGFVMTSLSFAMMAAGIIGGALFNRTGPKTLCTAGAAVLTAGYLLLARLHPDTATLYVVGGLIFVGFGLGLATTTIANMIMNSVPRTRQGMTSSLTGLLRFAPMTLGIAAYNLIFLNGILHIADLRGVSESAPAAIKAGVLSAGFDLAFFVSFLIGIAILALAFIIRHEIHPDNLEGGTEQGAGMI